MPSPSDLFPPTLMDLVGFGNTIAFIPFGILIPWLYRVSFVRFVSLFFIGILVLETVQALTFLGSFDINDALQNSVSAALGFGAYKLGFRYRSLGQFIRRQTGQYSNHGDYQRTNPEQYPVVYEMPALPGQELKITIKGDMKVWDVGYKRMQHIWN